MLKADRNYSWIFHGPGIEPWISGLLKGKKMNLILDAGCGYGFFGLIIKLYISPDSNLIGIDISNKKLGSLKNFKIYDSLICADVRYLPFRKAIFNIILSIEVLHELKNIGRILSDMENMLAPKGLIIVTGPSNESFLERLVIGGYCIYSCVFRGGALIDIRNNKFFTVYDTIWNRLQGLFTSLIHRLLGRRSIKYIFAFKELSALP